MESIYYPLAMKLHYLKQHNAMEDGRLHEAVIMKVTGGGLVCDIQDLGLHGFVPASFLKGGGYRRDRGRGKAGVTGSHTEYRPGDFIYLILDSLDFVRGSAIFRPAVCDIPVNRLTEYPAASDEFSEAPPLRV